MMNFRTIKAAIVQIFGDAEASRYQTVGYQRQSKNAAEVLGNSRFVQVFYSSGDFPESAAGRSGIKQHDCQFRIELTASASSKIDLSVFVAGTAPQKAAAIAAHLEASSEADESIDELIDIAYQEIMDNRNLDMGLAIGVVTNRWVSNIQKDTPPAEGEFVVLTASMLLSLRTSEEVTGETGTADANFIDTEINYGEDQDDKTGILVDNT